MERDASQPEIVESDTSDNETSDLDEESDEFDEDERRVKSEDAYFSKNGSALFCLCVKSVTEISECLVPGVHPCRSTTEFCGSILHHVFHTSSFNVRLHTFRVQFPFVNLILGAALDGWLVLCPIVGPRNEEACLIHMLSAFTPVLNSTKLILP